VRTGEVVEVEKSKFQTPSAFIFLYENQLFLTFRDQAVSVWNFRGELVTDFDDHKLWHPDCNTNNIFITAQQDVIMSYCRPQNDVHASQGSINISNILNGQLLAKLSADNSVNRMSATPDPGSKENERRALQDVTSLFYNEETNEIYTGNKHGGLHVWSA
jgi:hypothetical protein